MNINLIELSCIKTLIVDHSLKQKFILIKNSYYLKQYRTINKIFNSMIDHKDYGWFYFILFHFITVLYV